MKTKTLLLGTGLRAGEVTGLRWCDIDMESGMIDVNEAFEQEKQKQEDLGLHIRKENIQSVVCSFFCGN